MKTLIKQDISKYIIWIAIIGSFKWFDVINEV
jgi:hypothetical protein